MMNEMSFYGRFVNFVTMAFDKKFGCAGNALPAWRARSFLYMCFFQILAGLTSSLKKDLKKITKKYSETQKEPSLRNDANVRKVNRRRPRVQAKSLWLRMHAAKTAANLTQILFVSEYYTVVVVVVVGISF
jgi:hypothetical protein